MAGWTSTTLGDAAHWYSGGTPSRSKAEYWNGAIPWISAKSMDSVWLSDSQERVTELGASNGTRWAPQDSILILVRGSALHQRIPIGMATRPVTFNQDVKALVAKPQVLPEFLLYWLLANQTKLLHMVEFTGIGAGKLSTDRLAGLRLLLPPPSEQQAIAGFFRTLDDKIELNRQLNHTLEAIARAIFKSWFVDFDPVWANMEGRPYPLDPDTLALFPDTFEDSELGQIPKGWRVVPLKKQITATRGLSYKGSGLADAGLPMHNLNSIYEGGGYKYEGIKFYTGDYQERHLLNAGDVIIANTEQGFDRLLIGYAAIVPRYFGPRGLFSHHIYRVAPRPSSYLTSHFLYHLFVTNRYHGVISNYANGTTVNMLPTDGLEMPLFILPPHALVERFSKTVAPIHDLMEQSYVESETLRDLRDTLLPKLISGELRVLAAAELVEEAAS